MKQYGKLFGKIQLIKDTHHDEVYIGENGLIIMRNSIWLYDEYELLGIAYELHYYDLPHYPWEKKKPKTRKPPENKFHLLMWGYVGGY